MNPSFTWLLVSAMALIILTSPLDTSAQKTSSPKPQTGTLSKKVILTKPGSLSTLLTAAEKKTLTTLALKGPMDERDISCMWENMPGLTSIDLGEAQIVAYEEFKANELPRNSFFGKSKLKKIVLPPALTVIGYNCFYGCSSLKTLKLPDAVRKIDGQAFIGCGVESINIPASCEEGILELQSCAKLSSVSVSLQNQRYTERFGLVYTKKLDTLVFCPKARKADIGALDLDVYGLNVIGQGAFQDCKGITGTPVLPEGLLVIETMAFSGCSGLTGYIPIPTSVRRIESYAFAGCLNIESIDIEVEKPIDDMSVRGCYVDYGAFEGIEEQVMVYKELSDSELDEYKDAPKRVSEPSIPNH